MPSSDKRSRINVGVAAHITAAAEGGPRYDGRLTAEDRKSGENGIWLCQVCAKLIDSDVMRFTADMLRNWKKQAIRQAFAEIAKSGSNIGTLRAPFIADQ